MPNPRSDRQTDRQTDGRTDRETERQRNRETGTQREPETLYTFVLCRLGSVLPNELRHTFLYAFAIRRMGSGNSPNELTLPNGLRTRRMSSEPAEWAPNFRRMGSEFCRMGSELLPNGLGLSPNGLTLRRMGSFSMSPFSRRMGSDRIILKNQRFV